MEFIHFDGTELWRWGLRHLCQNCCRVESQQLIGVAWQSVLRTKPSLAFVVTHHKIKLDSDPEVYKLTEIQKKRPQISKPILVTYNGNPALYILPVSYAEQIGVKVKKLGWDYTVEFAN
ncbi:MAG: hypothetical protein ACO3YZ_03515 [Candidatus Nanopelagicaceae bacterium]